MINIYVNLILHGLKTIDDVPRSLRAAVEARLRELGI